jgi:hypothetical protein
MLYIKARRAGEHQETFLNLALDELKSTRTQLGDDHYPHEIQLILSVVYWRKSELLLDKADKTDDPALKELLKAYAKRNLNAAKRAKENFVKVFVHWKGADQAEHALPFHNGDDKSYWVDAVKAVWDL